MYSFASPSLHTNQSQDHRQVPALTWSNEERRQLIAPMASSQDVTHAVFGGCQAIFDSIHNMFELQYTTGLQNCSLQQQCYGGDQAMLAFTVAFSPHHREMLRHGVCTAYHSQYCDNVQMARHVRRRSYVPPVAAIPYVDVYWAQAVDLPLIGVV